MVCLDTSFLVDLLRGRKNAILELEKVESEGERITTTPISASELFEGAYGSVKMDEEVAKVRGLLQRVEILQFSLQASEKYGIISKELKTRGRKIGDMDTLIACIALTHNEPILTANSGHFKQVPGLLVRTW